MGAYPLEGGGLEPGLPEGGHHLHRVDQVQFVHPGIAAESVIDGDGAAARADWGSVLTVTAIR